MLHSASQLVTSMQRLTSVVLGQHDAAPAAGAIERGAEFVLLVPILTLLGAVLCVVCAARQVKSKLPAWISVGCLGVSFLVILAAYAQLTGQTRVAVGFEWIDFHWVDAHGHARSFLADFSFYVDSLTLLWMLFVTGLATLIALYASEYMAHDLGVGYSRFYFAFCLFVFSMTCLVMADNLVLLYLGWEGVGLCSYLLIGYFYTKPSAVAAAKKAFIVNRIGDLGLALGIMLAYVQFGSVRYEELFQAIGPYVELASQGQWEQIPERVQWIALLLMVGAFGKSAQLPLYVWLPDAMEGPTPVSALIHAATMVTAGVYLVARSYPFFVASESALLVVAWVGGLTALLAATIGMAQFDIKRIMAYSTVSQLGYMFAGLGVMTSVGAAFHVVTHAFFKALLFLACGAVMHGFAGQLDLRKLSGVRKMPGWGIVGVTMLVGCINLAGVPVITSGFWSKDMILAEAFTTPGYAALGWILLITAGLTAYYTFRVYFRVFEGPTHFEPGDELHAHDDHGHGHDDHHGHDHAHAPKHAHDPKHKAEFHPHPPGWAINAVLVILATLATLAIGLNFVGPKDSHGGWVGQMIHESSANHVSPYSAHGAQHEAHGTFLGMDPHAVMYIVSGVVAAIGIGISAWLHLIGRRTASSSRADALVPALGPLPGLARRKWLVDELYEYLFRRPLNVLAHVFHMIDKLLVDGLVNVFGLLPRWIGSAVRPSQNGSLHGYAASMAGGMVVLILIVLVASR